MADSAVPALIKQLRKEVFAETQEAFAERFGVDPSTVGRWERGAQEFSPTRLARVAAEQVPPRTKPLFDGVLDQLRAALASPASAVAASGQPAQSVDWDWEAPAGPLLPTPRRASVPVDRIRSVTLDAALAPAAPLEDWEALPGVLAAKDRVIQATRPRGSAVVAQALLQAQRPAFAFGVPWSARVAASLAAADRPPAPPKPPWRSLALLRWQVAVPVGLAAVACVLASVALVRGSSERPSITVTDGLAEDSIRYAIVVLPRHFPDRVAKGAHQARMVPDKPFPNQARAPCQPGIRIQTINDGCWKEAGSVPCNPEYEFEHKGRCYEPLRADPDKPVTLDP